MRSKRQTTMAKHARERLVQERRALKREKKQNARDARDAAVGADGADGAEDAASTETPDSDVS